MVQTFAISEKTTLKYLRENFNLHRTEDSDFFTEWKNELPNLKADDSVILNRITTRYFYQLDEGVMLEEGVKMMILSPLIDLAGFYDPPFKIKFEASVQLKIEAQDEVLQRIIDALIIHQQLWVWVMETKRTTFSLAFGIPQALAYMLCNPNQNQPTYGLLTSGDNFIFIKLRQQDSPIYALSKQFSIFNDGDLSDVLCILRKIGDLIIQS